MPTTHAARLPVIVSKGQSQNPVKRGLEDDLLAQLASLDGVQLIVIPHLYDLTPNGATYAELKKLNGDLVVLAWLYERATHWTLDRHGILGRVGESDLRNMLDDEDDDEDQAGDGAEAGDEKQRVIDARPAPDRAIYCFDLRLRDSAEPYLAEVKRLVAERQAAAPTTATAPQSDSLPGTGSGHPPQGNGNGQVAAGSEPGELLQWLQGTPRPDQLARYLAPEQHEAAAGPAVRTLDETGDRRWYPVIDFSRCTNCMECIDFCLFGVYGVDGQETILVEQPDNCRKGCPACSRVCPENAIIFPQHKTPTIAGAPSTDSGVKIDLSQLFGAPDALDVAARERDEQLLLAGRDAVGLSVGIPKRQAHKPEGDGTSDELDSLIDKLDELDI